MHLSVKIEYNASEGVKGMDIEKITGELEKNGKAEKLRELADSDDCRALGAMLDAAAVAKAASSGDGEAIKGILRQVLSTEEGKRIAQKISEAMK